MNGNEQPYERWTFFLAMLELTLNVAMRLNS